MAEPPDVQLDVDGPGAPPRSNGELVFAAPWERRVFGVTMTLTRTGAFDFESFRQRLIARVGEDGTRPYWRSWAAEDMLAESGTVTAADIDLRHVEYLARPHGHDHR